MELTREHFEQYLEDKLANVATKDDLKGFATKDDLQQLENKVDGMNVTMQGMRLDLAEVKEKVQAIDRRDLEDSNALASLVMDHERRIHFLEKNTGFSA